MMTHRRYSVASSLTLIIVVAAVWNVPARAVDEVVYWNQLALDIVKDSATHPPKAGRDLAIVHAAAAAYRALAGLYPTYEAYLSDALNARLAGIAAGTARDNGVALGQSVADSMLALRAGDGWDNGYTYTGSTDTGKWRPTPPGYQPGLAPHWKDVDPFVISSTADFLPGPPPALNSAEYAAAFNEVKSLGALNSLTRTADQDQIAEFWNDYPGTTATPAGKWNLIAQVLADQQGNSLAENARMFALLNVALADAGIVCWEAKYTYELWRPEDAIRLADTDGNPGTQADPAWTPNWPSPAFPEYTSGHSTFSGAAAEMLKLLLGMDDIALEIGAGFDVLPGVTRSYDSLSEAAMEAGRSRIYGGIHFEFANVAGMASGRALAASVYGAFARPVPEPGISMLVLIGTTCILRWKRALVR